jgi:hypothetical protein
VPLVLPAGYRGGARPGFAVRPLAGGEHNHVIDHATKITATLSRFHPGDTVSVTWVSPSGQQTTSRLHLAAGPPR